MDVLYLFRLENQVLFLKNIVWDVYFHKILYRSPKDHNMSHNAPINGLLQGAQSLGIFLLKWNGIDNNFRMPFWKKKLGSRDCWEKLPKGWKLDTELRSKCSDILLWTTEMSRFPKGKPLTQFHQNYFVWHEAKEKKTSNFSKYLLKNINVILWKDQDWQINQIKKFPIVPQNQWCHF